MSHLGLCFPKFFFSLYLWRLWLWSKYTVRNSQRINKYEQRRKNISFNYRILKSTVPILWYLIILICLLLISIFNMHTTTLDCWYFSDFIIIYLCILCPYIMMVVKLEHLHCETRLVFKKLNQIEYCNSFSW